MKLHFCFLNWSKWSPMIDGYAGGIQVRVCEICNKQQTRDTDYAEQVSASHINAAAETLLKGTKP